MTRKTAGKIVCGCLQVTEGEIVSAIKERRLDDVDGIAKETCAGEACMSCHPLLRDYLRRVRAAENASCPSLSAARPGSSPALSP